MSSVHRDIASLAKNRVKTTLITFDNLWPTGKVTDISPSSIGRLVVFGDLVWLLVNSLILGEGLVALASWAGSDLQPMALRLGLIGSAVKNIDESGSID